MEHKKKKALVFTISDYMNYGNRLQNYALIKILRNSGIEARNAPQIFCKEDYICVSDSSLEKLIKRIMPYSLWKKRIQSVFHNDADERYKNFLRFAAMYNDAPSVVFVKHNHEILEKIEGKEVSYFVSGSDQVWNPEFFKNLYINMLGFAPPYKKIAIAPSISVDKLEDWQKAEFQKYLTSFRALSCREQRGTDIIKEATGLECVTLIDPTLMLDAEEWDTVIERPTFHEDGKYLLIYFLGNLTAEYQEIIDSIAKKYNLKIIDAYITGKYYQCGPSEFVWLIKNCELMLTDSFHGTVFSYIYDKPVRVFKRKDHLGSMNSRLENLIKVLHLEDIFIDEINHCDDDFTARYDKKYLEIEKKRFCDYLSEVFDVKS